MKKKNNQDIALAIRMIILGHCKYERARANLGLGLVLAGDEAEASLFLPARFHRQALNRTNLPGQNMVDMILVKHYAIPNDA